jgi:hypothetical protein
MRLGKVHQGAVLHGKVVADAIYTGGVYFVVEDAAGDRVKVGVYNDARSRHATAARMFRTGQTVSIAEPYYKLGSEGQCFVRVNQPTCIKPDGRTPGPNADAWDQQAKHLAAARHAGVVNAGKAEPVVYNPLTKTGNTTVFLAWTYDEDVVFARV